MATNQQPGNTVAFSSLVGVMTSAKEKWDASGANEAVARATASIPQGTREYFTEASKQIFNREHLRTVTVYFGIGEERPFYIEKNPSLLMARLRHNMSFFYLNYMLLTAVLFLLTLLISPTAIVGIGLLALAWMYVIRETNSGSTMIYGVSISQTQAAGVMGIISLFVLLWLLSGVFWWTLFSSGFLIAVHALLRDASMHQDSEDKVVMTGELGEDAAFLGTTPSANAV